MKSNAARSLRTSRLNAELALHYQYYDQQQPDREDIIRTEHEAAAEREGSNESAASPASQSKPLVLSVKSGSLVDPLLLASPSTASSSRAGAPTPNEAAARYFSSRPATSQGISDYRPSGNISPENEEGGSSQRHIQQHGGEGRSPSSTLDHASGSTRYRTATPHLAQSLWRPQLPPPQFLSSRSQPRLMPLPLPATHPSHSPHPRTRSTFAHKQGNSTATRAHGYRTHSMATIISMGTSREEGTPQHSGRAAERSLHGAGQWRPSLSPGGGTGGLSPGHDTHPLSPSRLPMSCSLANVKQAIPSSGDTEEDSLNDHHTDPAARERTGRMSRQPDFRTPPGSMRTRSPTSEGSPGRGRMPADKANSTSNRAAWRSAQPLSLPTLDHGLPYSLEDAMLLDDDTGMIADSEDCVTDEESRLRYLVNQPVDNKALGNRRGATRRRSMESSEESVPAHSSSSVRHAVSLSHGRNEDQLEPMEDELEMRNHLIEEDKWATRRHSNILPRARGIRMFTAEGGGGPCQSPEQCCYDIGGDRVDCEGSPPFPAMRNFGERPTRNFLGAATATPNEDNRPFFYRKRAATMVGANLSLSPGMGSFKPVVPVSTPGSNTHKKHIHKFASDTPRRTRSISGHGAAHVMPPFVDLPKYYRTSQYQVGRFVDSVTVAQALHGEVRRAFDRRSGREVSLKVVPRSRMLPREHKELENVFVEACCLRYLYSSDAPVPLEFVARLLDIQEDDKFTYLIQEYYANGELYDVLKKMGRLNEKVVKVIALQLVFALMTIHANGICHRDISLENVLLAGDGSVRLIDFGQGETLSDRRGKYRSLMGPAGKAFYMAPEMHVGSYVGVPVDVFAFGVLLFILSVGSAPWRSTMPRDPEFRLVNSGAAGLRLLLQRNHPDIRLGRDLIDLLTAIFFNPAATRPSWDEILHHPWLGGDMDAWHPTVYLHAPHSEIIQRKFREVEPYKRMPRPHFMDPQEMEESMGQLLRDEQIVRMRGSNAGFAPWSPSRQEGNGDGPCNSSYLGDSLQCRNSSGTYKFGSPRAAYRRGYSPVNSPTPHY